jgi:hypothetical protein
MYSILRERVSTAADNSMLHQRGPAYYVRHVNLALSALEAFYALQQVCESTDPI